MLRKISSFIKGTAQKQDYSYFWFLIAGIAFGNYNSDYSSVTSNIRVRQRKKGMCPMLVTQLDGDRAASESAYFSLYLFTFNFFTHLQVAVDLVWFSPNLSPVTSFEFTLNTTFNFCFLIFKIRIMRIYSLGCCKNENEIMHLPMSKRLLLLDNHTF